MDQGFRQNCGEWVEYSEQVLTLAELRGEKLLSVVVQTA